jgi:lysophospholipase L1-like esterase
MESNVLPTTSNFFTTLRLCALSLLLLACTQHPDSSGLVMNPIPATATKLTYLALGDSYTIGESVSEYERWPVQLAGLLRQANTDIADPDIIARTGWTTAELQTAIKAANNTRQYDIVSLLIGVNNQYRGQSQEQYRAEFKELLQTATKFAKGRLDRVFVLSIPDWGVSPYAASRDKTKIATEINQFNAIAQDECQRLGIAFVDITPISRTALGDGTQFAADGLHFSGQQMAKWAEKAAPIAKALLAR